MFVAVSWTGAATAAPNQVHRLAHQGIERQYELHLPAGSVTSEPTALVISLHGKGQSTDSLRRWLRFEPISDRESFAVAYPLALELKWNYGRPIADPMPQVSDKPADDIGFIGAMITELIEQGFADPNRVYVAGASRGGLMAFTIACALSDRVAAVAPLITGMTELQREDCRPTRPAPMLVLAGTADLVQRYDGWLMPRGRLLSVPETLEYWRTLHGCTGQSAAPLPNIDRTDRSAVGVVRWTECRSGEPLVLYRIFGGGHRLPSLQPTEPGPPGPFGWRNRDMETAEEIWSFFRNLRLPQ